VKTPLPVETFLDNRKGDRNGRWSGRRAPYGWPWWRRCDSGELPYAVVPGHHPFLSATKRQVYFSQCPPASFGSGRCCFRVQVWLCTLPLEMGSSPWVSLQHIMVWHPFWTATPPACMHVPSASVRVGEPAMSSKMVPRRRMAPNEAVYKDDMRYGLINFDLLVKCRIDPILLV
jgi:hypothetical protein